MDKEKYCMNCGEEDDFSFDRRTASYSLHKSTNHYKCNSCGEEFSWIEDDHEDHEIDVEPKPVIVEPEFLGCGSHSCYLEKPRGMGTNGPCWCLDKLDVKMRAKVRLTLQRLRNEIKSAQ